MEEILRLFPEKIKQAIQIRIEDRLHSVQEIRFRLHQLIELIFDKSNIEWIGLKPNNDDYVFVLNQLSSFSLYRMEDELREGYITIDRKSTRLNSSHVAISYAVFCLTKKKKQQRRKQIIYQ